MSRMRCMSVRRPGFTRSVGGSNNSPSAIAFSEEMKAHISSPSSREMEAHMDVVSDTTTGTLGLKIMYRPTTASEWTLMATLDESDPADAEEDDGEQAVPKPFPTDPALLAADLAKYVPDLYSPFLAKGERQPYPLPAVWREEVFDTATNELIASAEYTQETPPPADEFSHLRWVISYFDDERGEWAPAWGYDKTEAFWTPILESLPGAEAMNKALVSEIVFRMILPIAAKNLPDTDRWRAEIFDGREESVIASTELPWVAITTLLDSAVEHLLV